MLNNLSRFIIQPIPKKNSLLRSWAMVLFYPIALVLLFLEWGWEPLAQFISRLARLPFIARLELKLVLLSPRAVMLIFCIPLVALLPIKILALYLFGKGHFILGTFLLVLAKVIGTAFCARVFQLTNPILMQVKWFSIWYPRWKNWKDGLLLKLKGSYLWRLMIFLKHKLQYWWKSFRQSY